MGSTAIVSNSACDLGPGSLQDAITTQQSPTSSSPASPSPSEDPNARTLVELVKCEAIAQTISSYKLSASYRFVTGQPNANLKYALEVSFPGCPFREMKQLSGSELQMEGTIEWLYELPGIGVRGDTEATEAKFQLSEEYDRQANRIDFLGISKPNTVQVDMSRIGL
jgi:hypothetical protein